MVVPSYTEESPTASKKTNGGGKGGKDKNHAAPGRAISLAQLRPFLEIAIPFFKEDRNAFCSLVGIVILTLIESALNIGFSYVRRDIFDALNTKDQVMFYKMIFIFFMVLVIIVPISVLYNYLRLKLALYWRKELTARVLDKYYANRTYYIIECCRDIDNPDQRICEDLTEFTSTSLDFFFIVFDAVINLLSFSAVLFQIYPLLFVAIILYAFVGTLISARLGKSLVSQYYDKLTREADFRFGLIRTRENAEGIAFYDSEASMEQINLWSLFEKAIETQLGIIRTQRTLELFTTSYDYLVYVIPYLVVAPLYFSGKLNLGSITQSSEAFYYVRSDFSIIVNYFEKISAFSAGIDRLSTFIHRINEGGWQSEPIIEDVEVLVKSKGTLTDLTRSLAGSPEGYLKVSDDDNDDITRINKNRKSTIQLITGPLEQRVTPGLPSSHTSLTSHPHIPIKGETKRLVLQCEDLSVYTPDGYRTLIGGLLGPKSGILTPQTGLTGSLTGTLIGTLNTTELASNLRTLHTPNTPYTPNTPIKEHSGVNFHIYEGDKVLVVGPSGTGKSSLLRAISGLWELGSGRIIWNSSLNEASNAVGDCRAEKMEAPQGVFFLPQKPYNLLGSLRQQIAYPDIFPGEEEVENEGNIRIQSQGKHKRNRGNRVGVNSAREENRTSNLAAAALDGDSELLDILRKVRLETLASRMGGGDEQGGLGQHKDWSKVLSLGEQQRLAFARVLYNRQSISVCVLDEATSALDEAAEAAMYNLLGELNITYISVGHRDSLCNYHTKKLSLLGPGREVDFVDIGPRREPSL